MGEPTDTDLSEKPYDLNGDRQWDARDLCLMKAVQNLQPSAPGAEIIEDRVNPNAKAIEALVAMA